MAARTSRSDWASESASSAALDGAGVIGDSIGITTTHFITTDGTTPEAGRFTTGAISTEEEEAFVAAPTQATGPATLDAAEFTTVPAQRIGLSTETTGLLEDTLIPTVRAGPARAPSAATTMADRQRAFRHAEAPASVAEGRVLAAAEGLAVAVAAAGIDNPRFVVFPVDR